MVAHRGFIEEKKGSAEVLRKTDRYSEFSCYTTAQCNKVGGFVKTQFQPKHFNNQGGSTVLLQLLLFKLYHIFNYFDLFQVVLWRSRPVSIQEAE